MVKQVIMNTNKILFSIRKAKNGDFEAIKTLEHQCFTEDAYDDEVLQQLIKNTRVFHTWVTELLPDKEIVGYVSIYLETKSEGVIVSICTNPKYQKKGIGTALIETTLNFAIKQHLQRLFLTVDVNNHDAISLYKKMGFQMQGIITNYYASGNSAYVMMKKLTRKE